MKYGREVEVSGQIRLTEVTDIPVSGQAAPLAWLKVHKGTDTGWVSVLDTNQSGDVKNGSVYEAPLIPPSSKPKTLTRLQFVRLCQTAGGMTDENLVAARADSNLAALWIKLELAEDVSRNDPDTASGLAALEFLNYLPEGASAVISGWPNE